MTNCERSSGVCLPFRGGVISRDGPRVDDWGVGARGRGVVFLEGGLVELVLGNRENPPEGPALDDMLSIISGPSFCIKQTMLL